MAVHMFVIESVHASLLGGDSITPQIPSVRDFFAQADQRGYFEERSACKGISEVRAAVDAFFNWATNLPTDDPKWLWISVHGRTPEFPQHVGTAALSASPSGAGEYESFDWAKVFVPVDRPFPPKVVVVLDVCWGGSPSAASRMSQAKGLPSLVFGPARAAHRVELTVASGLVAALLSTGQLPPAERARELVRVVNDFFHRDEVTDNEFYRVWIPEQGRMRSFPQPKAAIKRSDLAS